MTSPDVVIIGGGHNGLICAAYLAKAGRKVVVLERAEMAGGAAVTRSFAAGFKVSAGAHILNMLSPKVIKDLKLKSHGLDLSGPALKTTSLLAGGALLQFEGDKIAAGDISPEDKQAYHAFRKRMRGLASLLNKQFLRTPPRLARAGWRNNLALAKLGFDLRFGLGKAKMEDLMRLITMDIHGLVEECFESEALRGAIAFDAVLGTALEPRMPGTVLNYLYRLAGEQDAVQILPKGGMGAVAEALKKAVEAHGGEVRTGALVDHIIVENGCAVGVALADGELLRARAIVSSADPKTTFNQLLGAQHLEAGFANRVSHIRAKGRIAKLHLALNSLPAFKGVSESQMSGRLLIAPSMDYIDQAHSQSKYHAFSDAPTMEITIPSLIDPTLAPAGKHVMSAIVSYAPYVVKGGWEGQKYNFVARCLDVLASFDADFKGRVAATECLTPVDLENQFGMTGGHWHHVELAFDQFLMMRPVHGAAQYKAPVDGLFLCGAGCHPGGGVMGLAGHNAAQVILAGGVS